MLYNLITTGNVIHCKGLHVMQLIACYAITYVIDNDVYQIGTSHVQTLVWKYQKLYYYK